MVPSRSAVRLNDVSPGIGPTVTACALFVTTTSAQPWHTWFTARIYGGGMRSAHSWADNGGLTIKTSVGLDSFMTLDFYRDRRPGSRGLYLLEVSLFNFCFLNKGIYDFGFEKVRHSVWSLGCKEWIRNAFVLIHTCIWTRESDSIGMGTSKKKNTLQLGPKLSYNLDLDQVVYLLRPITDLDVCLSLFFCQTPRGEFFRFGTSMGWLDLGFRGSNVKVAVIPPA